LIIVDVNNSLFFNEFHFEIVYRSTYEYIQRQVCLHVVFEGSHFGIFLSALVPDSFFRHFYVVFNQTFTQYLSSELRRCSRVFFVSFTLDVYSIFVANITYSLSEQSQQYPTSKSSSSNYYRQQDSFHSHCYVIFLLWYSTSDGVLVRLIAETVMRCSGPLWWVFLFRREMRSFCSHTVYTLMTSLIYCC